MVKVDNLLKRILFMQMYLWLLVVLIYVNKKDVELSNIVPVLMIVNGMILGILGLLAKSKNVSADLAGLIVVFVNIIATLIEKISYFDYLILILNIFCFMVYLKRILESKKKELENEKEGSAVD